jgi:hypothetical protein
MSLMDEALMLDAESAVDSRSPRSAVQAPSHAAAVSNGEPTTREPVGTFPVDYTVVDRIRALNLGMQIMLGREPLSLENIHALAPLQPDEWSHLILAMIARSEGVRR